MQTSAGAIIGGLAILATACGGAAGQTRPTRPTVIIEEGQLFLVDELASDQVPMEIRFEHDSDVIGPESRRPLEVLAEFIASHGELGTIEVHGHTDEQGTPAYNMALSRRRARAVVAFLVEAGVGEERLRARGFGDSRPVVRATTPDARARNRRVEFVIVNER
jgi:outer membrane protein OmpA-like peptidoglycan-associated protein